MRDEGKACKRWKVWGSVGKDPRATRLIIQRLYICKKCEKKRIETNYCIFFVSFHKQIVNFRKWFANICKILRNFTKNCENSPRYILSFLHVTISISFRPKNCVRDKTFRTFRESFSNFSPSRKFFRRPNFFQNLADGAAIRLVQKTSKSEPSSPVFGRLKFRESLSRTSSFKIFYADTK